MSTEPITGLSYQEAGSLQTDALQNAMLNWMAAWTNAVVQSVGGAAPPGSPVNGDRYIVGTGTGAWTGQDGKLAVYRDGWHFYAPIEGVAVKDLDSGDDYEFVAAAWTVKGGGGSGGLADGDYGDVTVGGSGTTMTIDHGVVTYAKMQDVSATSRVLGRSTAGAGDVEECTLSQVLDMVGGAADGDILYRSAGAWTRLAAGTNTHVLTLASGLPTWAAAGGGLTNFTESVSTSAPNATVPVVAFVAANAATNVDVALVTKGTGSLMLAIPDGTAAGGNKRGTEAIDLQIGRSSADQVASGDRAVLVGRASKSSGSDSITIGSNASATNTGSVAIGASTTCTSSGGVAIGSASTSGTEAVGIGKNALASGMYALAFGRDSSCSGNFSVVLGYNATAAGSNSVALGYGSKVYGERSVALSGADARYLHGSMARRGHGSAALAYDWLGEVVTTNATAQRVRSDGSGTSYQHYYTLGGTRASAMRVQILARQTGGTSGTAGDCAAWDFPVLLKSISSATSLVGTPATTAFAADSGATTWAVSVAADDSNDALNIQVTGEANKSITWSVRITAIENA